MHAAAERRNEENTHRKCGMKLGVRNGVWTMLYDDCHKLD